MRMLLILSILFIQATTTVMASPSISTNVESIDLNLMDDEMAVSFFRLSVGEATLIQGPNKENILVNTGEKESKAELEEWLYLYRVRKIHTLILTSGQDLPYYQIHQLILKYHIKEVIVAPELVASLTNHLHLNNQLVVQSWREGTKNVIFPELTAVVPFTGLEKNEGLDLLFQFFQHRLFLMTSFSKQAEKKLINTDLRNISVLKVPNYGKKDSLSERFIQYVNPHLSILFSAGKQLPDPNIVHDLLDTWSEVYFTKRDGTITIKFTESNYEVFSIPVESEE